MHKTSKIRPFFLATVTRTGQLPGQHPEINTRDSRNTQFLVKTGNLEFDDEQARIGPAG